ncbi:MAG: pentapeptide repeat-containing protein [Isosphaeraceae bacterium]|nr:pentapeptide repeat-containing protein [Isosphaeraceae bacterium]
MLPWIGPSVGAGAAIGAGLFLSFASGPASASRSLHALMGGAVGAILGAFVGMIGAVSFPSAAPGVQFAGDDPRDLWDAWLDEPAEEPADSPCEEPDAITTMPARAPVRPRVRLHESGDALPLEDELLPLIKTNACGAIHIAGPDGSGKSTAIRHLSAVLPSWSQLVLLDQPDASVLAGAAATRLAVYASDKPLCPKHLATYQLAPWSRDEQIEYLLSVARERCASVMARLALREQEFTDAPPELWGIVLDRMIEDEAVEGPRQALRLALHDRLGDLARRRLVGAYCLVALTSPQNLLDNDVVEARNSLFDATLVRWLRHHAVQRILGAEFMAAELSGGEACDFLAVRLPTDLVAEAGSLISNNDIALIRLRTNLVLGDRTRHAMAASLLHATGTDWKPEPGQLLCLEGADLTGASWAGLDLTQVFLQKADLSGANLRGTNLRGGCVSGARLEHAQLCEADLSGLIGDLADLSYANLMNINAFAVNLRSAKLNRANLHRAQLGSADLSHADLSGACLRDASLNGANLQGGAIDGADFRGASLAHASLRRLKLSRANFQGARFRNAILTGCDLEEMQLSHAQFRDANLDGALLTGSYMPSADFRAANLRNTGLGEIEWENANLNGADLRGATFHLGSTRSGLVNSPIACEGSRTGFYTDDFHELDFKAPEEIRKANLRGADLRGARIDGVDFYLVDLRDALYDPGRAEHLRRCGAILEHRT